MHTRMRRGLRHAVTCGVLLALVACSAPPPLASGSQPALAELARPYARQLAAAHIAAIESTGRGAMVRSTTDAGTVYTRYPDGVASLRFTLLIDAGSVRAQADDFDAARADAWTQALRAIVPEAIGAAQRNNRMMYERANPDR